MNTRKSLAFTVELLGLFILLILVIVMITQIFVMSRSKSLEAKRLTEAVIIAENTAETASVSPDPDVLTEKIRSMESVISAEFEGQNGTGDLVAVCDTDGNPESSDFVIRIERKTEKGDHGIYADDSIHIYYGDAEMKGEPLYTLDSGSFFGEKEYDTKGQKQDMNGND